MKNSVSYSIAMGLRVVAIALALLCAREALAQEKVLTSFQYDVHHDGYYPGYGRLISDAAGNLYGTTIAGGTGSCQIQYAGCGTVFELSPQTGGGWTRTILHSFQNNGNDGINPFFGVAMDAAGNLYGTTRFGGNGGCTADEQPPGCGTIFELSHQPDGTWKEKRLRDFQDNGKDGIYPFAPVVLDSAGNLYGTTVNGGGCNEIIDGCGTIFELSPSGDGGTYKLLHRFRGGFDDGVFPSGALTFDSAGKLYGTTAEGGDGNQCDIGCGTVYELSQKNGGGWRMQLLYSFSGNEDAFDPNGDLIIDAGGNLYGTTFYGGDSLSDGAVFKLLRMPKGWIEETLYSFGNYTGDGTNVTGGLELDSTGNLYGTTSRGGSSGLGIIFELSPSSGGKYTESIAYDFQGIDGASPIAGLISDLAGNFYGTTSNGGGPGYDGTVFEFTPQSGSKALMSLGLMPSVSRENEIRKPIDNEQSIELVSTP